MENVENYIILKIPSEERLKRKQHIPNMSYYEKVRIIFNYWCSIQLNRRPLSIWSSNIERCRNNPIGHPVLKKSKLFMSKRNVMKTAATSWTCVVCSFILHLCLRFCMQLTVFPPRHQIFLKEGPGQNFRQLWGESSFPWVHVHSWYEAESGVGRLRYPSAYLSAAPP